MALAPRGPGLGRNNPEPAGAVTALHTTAVYRQEATAVCEGGVAYETGAFDNYNIETWVDEVGGNSRAVVSYRGGSTSEVVRIGKTEGQVYARGDFQGRAVGCRFGEDTIGLATAQDDPFRLALTDLGGLTTDPGEGVNFSSTEVQDNPEMTRVESLCGVIDYPVAWLSADGFDFGSDGGHCIAQLNGRTVRIMVLTQLGTYFISDTDHRESRLAHLDKTDLTSGSLIQALRRSSIEGVGDVFESLTVIEQDEVEVSGDFFATAGMDHLDGYVSLD